MIPWRAGREVDASYTKTREREIQLQAFENPASSRCILSATRFTFGGDAMSRKLPAFLFLSLWAAQAQMPKDAASLAAGKKLYEYHCAFCHGRGDDGFAANLVSPRLPHAPTDSSLFNVIKNGIPGTDMAAALGLTDKETWQVAAFVRSLGRSAPQNVPGDAA